MARVRIIKRGASYFLPQYKGWFGWRSYREVITQFRDGPGLSRVINFSTEAQTMEFLMEKTKVRKVILETVVWEGEI